MKTVLKISMVAILLIAFSGCETQEEKDQEVQKAYYELIAKDKAKQAAIRQKNKNNKKLQEKNKKIREATMKKSLEDMKKSMEEIKKQQRLYQEKKAAENDAYRKEKLLKAKR